MEYTWHLGGKMKLGIQSYGLKNITPRLFYSAVIIGSVVLFFKVNVLAEDNGIPVDTFQYAKRQVL
jgi:hypothetical protein